MRIDDEYFDRFFTDGYVLVPDFLQKEELERCRQEVLRYFPTGEEMSAQPERFTTLRKSAGFPFAGPTLNHVATHPDIIDFVERVLGTPDIRLGDSILQAKYGPDLSPSKDQRLHNDAWGRNTLVPPRSDGAFGRVVGIVYYTDVHADHAPTHVVHRKHSEDVPLLSTTGYSAYDPAEFPQLYAAQEPVTAAAGSLLLFTGRTVHRGSALHAPGAHRFAHFVNYHSTASGWLDTQTWSGSPASPNGPAVREFMESATPRQRSLLGFPAPGDPYWTEDVLGRTAELYPGMDLAPYAGA